MAAPKGNARFNTEAAAWDTNPNVVLASSLALTSVLSHFPILKTSNPTIDVLEIGCGTGLLSLIIAPYVRSLVAVDAAGGMIDALNSKLQTQEFRDVKNVLPVCALLENPDDERIGWDSVTGEKVERRRYDLVISHLVLHHIADLKGVFKTMEGALKEGGSVALTDFEDFGPEARRFHAEARMEGVERHGIERGEVKRLLEEAGLVDVKVEKAFEMEKWVEKVPGGGVVKGEGGVKMVFPFLICMGKKA